MTSNRQNPLAQYRLLGRSGLRVSPLTLGTMTFGTEWGWGSDEEESRAIFEAYLERGGNSIDTANFYTGGTSEKMLGRFIEKRRNRLVIATKYTLNMERGDPNAGGNHRKSLVRSVEDSLRRLGTDYIDLLWIHAWESYTPIEEFMRGLDDLVRQGRILYIGMSNAPAWVVARANTLAEIRGWTSFVGLQIHYNLLRREVERELMPMGRALGIAVLPWSPLGGGVLTGKYNGGGQGSPLDASLRREQQAKGVSAHDLEIAAETVAIARELGCSAAQVAIAWLLGRPGVVSPVIGARTRAQLDDNLAALDVALSAQHLDRLDRVSQIDLGYPHSYLQGRRVRDFILGGTEVEG